MLAHLKTDEMVREVFPDYHHLHSQFFYVVNYMKDNTADLKSEVLPVKAWN